MTNQNNELDQILDNLYCDAWFAGRVAEREQSGIRSVTPKFDEAKKAIQALYAPTDRTFVEPRNSAPKPVEKVNKTPNAVDFTAPKVNLIDIASPNMTPEASKVVSDAIERSAEVMNKTAKPVENGELWQEIYDTCSFSGVTNPNLTNKLYALLAQEKAKWGQIVLEDVIGPDYFFTDDAMPTEAEKVTQASLNRLLERQRQALAKLLDKENV